MAANNFPTALSAQFSRFTWQSHRGSVIRVPNQLRCKEQKGGGRRLPKLTKLTLQIHSSYTFMNSWKDRTKTFSCPLCLKTSRDNTWLKRWHRQVPEHSRQGWTSEQLCQIRRKLIYFWQWPGWSPSICRSLSTSWIIWHAWSEWEQP